MIIFKTCIIISNKKRNEVFYMETNKDYETFAAIKLIEELYKNSEIEEVIFNNILRDNSNNMYLFAE